MMSNFITVIEKKIYYVVRVEKNPEKKTYMQKVIDTTYAKLFLTDANPSEIPLRTLPCLG